MARALRREKLRMILDKNDDTYLNYFPPVNYFYGAYVSKVRSRAIHDSHSPVGFGRLSRQKAHKLRAHGSNSSMGNGSTRIQVWISDRTQVPAGHGSPAILLSHD